MKSGQYIYLITSLILASRAVFGTEFTFDLSDSTEQCFYEVVQAGVHCSFDYQVLNGGQLDVDVSIEGPNEHVIYKELRKEYDTIQFNTTDAGEYAICFSNEFSTFTHKTVFMSFEAGDENPLFKGAKEHSTVMTFMEATADDMHYTLEDIINGQTHYRLQESYGRRFAEELNEQVLLWSMLETFVMFAISISQVLILRNFFSEPKHNKPTVPMRQPRFGYSRM